jgi:hypothetical protein
VDYWANAIKTIFLMECVFYEYMFLMNKSVHKQRVTWQHRAAFHTIEPSSSPGWIVLEMCLVFFFICAQGHCESPDSNKKAISGTSDPAVISCIEADLRTAVSKGGSIQFAGDGKILLSSPIVVTNDVVIDGIGHQITISGSNAVRVFEVNTNVSFTARNLAIVDGKNLGIDEISDYEYHPPGNGYGAGILNSGGIIYLFNCSMSNHVVVGGRGIFSQTSGMGLGAAICNFGGQVSLTNCAIRCNSSIGTTQKFTMSYPNLGGALGGAVYSKGGSILIQNSIFETNVASSGPQQVGMPSIESYGNAAKGGALYVEQTYVVIQQTCFQNNTVLGNKIDRGFDYGAMGGALCLESGEANILHCSFIENSAAADLGSGVGSGGGIQSSAHLRIEATDFVKNKATGGDGSSRWFTYGGGGLGGGINSTSDLILIGCTFDHNNATSGDGYTGYLTTPITPQIAAKGGAINSSGNLAITNCTLSFNLALAGLTWGMGGPFSYSVGNISQGGGLCSSGSTVMVNVTLAHNVAQSMNDEHGRLVSELSQGDNICQTNGNLNLFNSIIAYGGSGINCFGTITDGGHNLSSDASAHFTNEFSMNNTDPLLQPLADNGGPTLTMALDPASPAVDAADNTAAPAVDQRGVVRPIHGICDMGAFELGLDMIGRPKFSYSLVNRLLKMTVRGKTDLSFDLQMSGKIEGEAWSSIRSVSLTNGVATFDIQPPASGNAFWRLKSLP